MEVKHCHFPSPILLVMEQFSRKWKVSKKLFMNVAPPQHLPCPTKVVMTGEQNQAGNTRQLFSPNPCGTVEGLKSWGTRTENK